MEDVERRLLQDVDTDGRKRDARREHDYVRHAGTSAEAGALKSLQNDAGPMARTR